MYVFTVSKGLANRKFHDSLFTFFLFCLIFFLRFFCLSVSNIILFAVLTPQLCVYQTKVDFKQDVCPLGSQFLRCLIQVFYFLFSRQRS